MTRRWFGVAILIAIGLACRGGPSPEDARRLVMTYLGKVTEAYRSSDEQIVDALVSEPQALKLVGLIGVKRDADVYLDAQLLDINFEKIAPGKDRI